MSQQDIEQRIYHYEFLKKRFLKQNREVQADHAELSLVALRTRLQARSRHPIMS